MNRRNVLTFLAGATLGSAFVKSPAAPVISAAKPVPEIPVAKESFLRGKSVQGSAWDLATQKGKFTLISFFAAERAACRAEMPLLRNFYEDNARKGFAMAAVSLDQDRRDIESYASILFQLVPATQRFPMFWRNDSGYQDGFGVISKTPTHFMFDRAGRLFKHRLGVLEPDDWDDLWTAMTY